MVWITLSIKIAVWVLFLFFPFSIELLSSATFRRGPISINHISSSDQCWISLIFHIQNYFDAITINGWAPQSCHHCLFWVLKDYSCHIEQWQNSLPILLWLSRVSALYSVSEIEFHSNMYFEFYGSDVQFVLLLLSFSSLFLSVFVSLCTFLGSNLVVIFKYLVSPFLPVRLLLMQQNWLDPFVTGDWVRTVTVISGTQVVMVAVIVNLKEDWRAQGNNGIIAI